MKTLNQQGLNKMTMNLVEFLVSEPQFNSLSNDELQMLDKIMLVADYRDGHKFKSNDNIYLVIEGDVAERYEQESGIMQLNRIASGDLFGLYSLVDTTKKTAICSAVGSVRAASLPRSAFELLINSNLPLGKHFRRVAKLMNNVEQQDNNNTDTAINALTEQHWNDFTVSNAGMGQ